MERLCFVPYIQLPHDFIMNIHALCGAAPGSLVNIAQSLARAPTKSVVYSPLDRAHTDNCSELINTIGLTGSIDSKGVQCAEAFNRPLRAQGPSRSSLPSVGTQAPPHDDHRVINAESFSDALDSSECG